MPDDTHKEGANVYTEVAAILGIPTDKRTPSGISYTLDLGIKHVYPDVLCSLGFRPAESDNNSFVERLKTPEAKGKEESKSMSF